MTYKIAIVLTSIIIMGCSTANQTGKYYSQNNSEKFLYQLVRQHPTQDTLQAILVDEAILRQGSDAVLRIGQMLESDDDADKVSAQNALMSLNTYVTKIGMQSQREKFLSGMYQILQSNLNDIQKASLIQFLNISGDQSSIPYISPFLSDLALCEPACQALVAINTTESGETLQKNVSLVSGQNLISIIKSLGDLGYTPAAEEILTYADVTKPEIHLVVLYSLANMGYPPASLLFESDYTKYDPNDQVYITSLYLRWLKNSKNTDQVVARLRKIIEDTSDKYKSNVKIEALSELMVRIQSEAISDITAFVKKSDQKSRIAALELATKTYDNAIVSGLSDLLKNSSPEIQTDIIYTFGRRQYPSTIPIISDYLNHDDKRIRITTINALARAASEKGISSQLLESLAHNEDKEELAALKYAFFQIPGEIYIPAMVIGMNDYSPAAKITALEILSERLATDYIEPVLVFLENDSTSVRIAALKALKTLAGPDEYEKVLSHFINCTDLAEKKAAGDALVVIASEIGDQEKRLAPIFAYYQKKDIESKKQILPLLSRLGGKQSLDFLLTESQSRNPQINDAAIRTMANWSGYEALEPLVELADNSKDVTYQVLAIRGCLQILGENELGTNYEVDVCNRLMNIAERGEEKTLILSAMSAIRSEESLATISEFIADPNLGDDAARAVLNISTPQEEKTNLRSDQVAKALIQTWRGKKSTEVEPDSMNVPEGFTALFNGVDLSGWKGLVANPVKRAKMSQNELASAQIEADKLMREHWRVIDGILCFDGKGQSLCTLKDFGNFEMLVDWKIEKNGDSGIYLRGSPQVQIWDAAMNPVGSGGLYNNQKNPSTPQRAADNLVGEWNRFRIIMIGSKVTIYLNEKLVVDNVIMENYWERDKPIYATDAIELQAHHNPLYFKNIFIKELPAESEEDALDTTLFNGTDLTGWELVGAKEGSWRAENGILLTEGEGGGWISTTREFADFELDLEFRVPPDGNSGVFIRAPREGNPAYNGMEIQVLDDYADKYANLNLWQYTGSIYAVQAPSKRMTKKADQWQKMKIICDGPHVQIILNGESIIDANLIDYMNQTNSHPGLKNRKGFIGLQNHSSKIEYRNIKIKAIDN